MTALAPTIGKKDVGLAARELDKMKRSLRGWLSYRLRNDAVVSGNAPAKLDRTTATRIIESQRDWQAEQKLAEYMHALLSDVMPDAALPSPDLSSNPNAAVELAKIVLAGGTAQTNAPQAQGIVWMWPLIIVGGVLLAVTTAIKSYADVAKERERYACIKAGACTDYGFWLKLGVVGIGGYLVLTKTNVVSSVKGMLGGRK